MHYYIEPDEVIKEEQRTGKFGTVDVDIEDDQSEEQSIDEKIESCEKLLYRAKTRVAKLDKRLKNLRTERAAQMYVKTEENLLFG